jgi:uroporphyrinogen-III synthase
MVPAPSSRVLITRSPYQASELADALRARGLEPVLVPAIEFATPASFAALDAALVRLFSRSGQLDSFHWLLFTSANAVDAFHQRLQSVAAPQNNAKDLFPASCRIAAIGPATARALQTLGLTPTLVPPQAVAESLAASLLPCARQPDGSPTRFLLVRAEQARDHLPETLRAAGAEVTIAPAYRTVVPAGSIDALRALFASPPAYPDAITFTSSSTARNLLALLEAAGLTLPPVVLRVSIGPITSQSLRDLGLPPHAEAAEATIPSLAAAVVKALEPA